MNEPVYQRIAANLRDKVADGQPIPGVSELARRYACTRPTVRRAINLLQREGVLGTDRQAIESKLVTLGVSDEESIQFIADLVAAGHTTVDPDIKVDHRNDTLVRTVLRMVDGEPHNWAEWVFFPLSRFVGTRLDYDVDIPEGSIKYLKEGLECTGLEQRKWIEARMPSQMESAVLQMTGGPVIVEHREGSQDGTRLFASVRILRADRTRLVP